MKDSRVGQCLWSIWEGFGYSEEIPNSITYYTEDHVDIEHEVVRKALASLIQREGLVYSLAQGFQAIDSGMVTQGWIGFYEEELYQEVCDEEGYTLQGAKLANVTPVTFVEVPDYV
jgi:hypothetical protein